MCRISEPAGSLIEMAIDWTIYLQAFVTPIAAALGVQQGDLRTKRVSGARMATSKILEELSFDKRNPAVVGRDGLCIVVTSRSGENFLIYHRPASAGPVNGGFAQCSSQFGLVPIVDIDPFIFFAVKNLKLRIDLSRSVGDLVNYLEFEDKENFKEIDFDKACSIYGFFAVWKITRPVATCDLVLLLSVDSPGYILSFSENYNDFGVSKIEGIRVFDIDQYLKSAFSPLNKLLEQSIKFGDIKFSDAEVLRNSVEFFLKEPVDVVLGPQSRAYFDFKFNGKTYLCLPLSNLAEHQINEVIDYIQNVSGIQEALSVSHIVAFSHHLQSSFLPSQRFIATPNSIVDTLDIDGKLSIDADQLLALYDEYYVFDISNAVGFSKWDVLCNFSIEYEPFRSSFITNPIIDSASRLAKINNIPNENIYLSLSASHWKHSFLEVYRIIEGLYYFPWMRKLRNSLKSQLNEFSLFNQCKQEASWSYTEQASIMSLFELIPLNAFDGCHLTKIPCLDGKFTNKKDDEILRSFASALYAIRNTNVHQGLHNPKDEIYPTNRCWEHLTYALYLAAEYIYTTHPEGVPPR